jgi:hypothetical protein
LLRLATEKEILKQPDKGCAISEILLHILHLQEWIEMEVELLIQMKSATS